MTMTMNDDTKFYKTRLRAKGQVTLPAEVRELLSLDEGDDLLIRVNESGKIEIQLAVIVPSDQAYFWSKRWQELERAAQADIEAGRVKRFSSVNEAISALEDLDAGN
jgi:AbrB family looped-hinge helix DNA binding protein